MRSDQRRMVPFDREDVAVCSRDATNNELKVDGKVDHIARLQGPSLKGRRRQVHR